MSVPSLPPEPTPTLREVFRAVLRTWRLMDERNLGLLSAGVAFYAFMSLFPAMAAVIAIWGYGADPAMIADQMELVRELVPEEAYTLLTNQVMVLVGANRSTLQWASVVSIVLAIWSARVSVAALIRGLNTVHQVPHRSNPLRRAATAYLLTVLLVLVAVLAFASVIIVPAVLAFVGLPAALEIAVEAAKWLVLLAVVFFAIALVYRYGPNRRQARPRWLSPGAGFAVLAWAVGSFALAYYVRNFGQLNEVYGSLGAVVALLFWCFLSALVTLLGAQFNVVLRGVLAERDPVAEKIA